MPTFHLDSGVLDTDTLSEPEHGLMSSGTEKVTLGRLFSGVVQAIRGRGWFGTGRTTAPDLWGDVRVINRSHPATVISRTKTLAIITRTKELTIT